jgi:hypothetical protein
MAEWWHFLVAFPAAALLVNGIPHFVQGISGKPFPSPFTGGPPNNDVPWRNVLWGSGNMIVGAVLLWLIRDGLGNFVLVTELVVIAVACAAALGLVFGNPERFSRRRGP